MKITYLYFNNKIQENMDGKVAYREFGINHDERNFLTSVYLCYLKYSLCTQNDVESSFCRRCSSASK